jgi:hypothetical protein
LAGYLTSCPLRPPAHFEPTFANTSAKLRWVQSLIMPVTHQAYETQRKASRLLLALAMKRANFGTPLLSHNRKETAKFSYLTFRCHFDVFRRYGETTADLETNLSTCRVDIGVRSLSAMYNPLRNALLGQATSDHQLFGCHYEHTNLVIRARHLGISPQGSSVDLQPCARSASDQ